MAEEPMFSESLKEQSGQKALVLFSDDAFGAMADVE
jgi:hypothetical protein